MRRFLAVTLMITALVVFALKPTDPRLPELSVKVPSVEPVVVKVVEGYKFGNAPDPAVAEVTFPDGKWQKIVLHIEGYQKGVQFDRIMTVFVDEHVVFVGITPEPIRSGIHWVIDKDVTEYLPILRGKRVVHVMINNYTSKVYTGVPEMSVEFRFYPATDESNVARATSLPNPDEPFFNVPNELLPIPTDNTFKNKSASLLKIIKPGQTLTYEYEFPKDTVAVELWLYALSQLGDEFYWADEPAFREIEITIDGKPAGVIWPFPYIYTGGVNPLLWRPVSAIKALNIPAYKVDLSPFAGYLSGGKHTIGIRVHNLKKGYWVFSGSLAVYRSGEPTWGQIVENTLELPTSASTEATTLFEGNRVYLESAVKDYRIVGVVGTRSGVYRVCVKNSMSFDSKQSFFNKDYSQFLRNTQVATYTTLWTKEDGYTLERTIRRVEVTDVAYSYLPKNDEPKGFFLPANVNQMTVVRRTLSENGVEKFWDQETETVLAQAAWYRLKGHPSYYKYTTTSNVVYISSKGERRSKTIVANNGRVVLEEEF